MQTYLQCGRFRLPLAGRPLVMGILNVTPDSFSDGGRFLGVEAALSHAERLVEEGADLIDLGAESTRPGAVAVPVEEELRRLLPLVEALHTWDIPLSCDTRKPEVMRAVLAAGVDMINDIQGFRSPEALSAVKHANCAVCIMHMQQDPATMQDQPRYEDVVAEVAAFLCRQKETLLGQGVAAERICIDPGFGFGKTLAHNLSLLKCLRHFQQAAQVPVLAGLSRKSMIGSLTGKPPQERAAGSVAAALAAAMHGARILRVHDVAATVDALKVWEAAVGFGEQRQQI